MSTEKSTYILNGTLSYTVKRNSRSRLVKLSVYHDGRCVVTAPNQIGMRMIENFIKQKYSWIEKKIAFFKEHPIQFLQEKSKPRRRLEYLKYKEQARVLVSERLSFFNQHYSYVYNRISIKDTKSRWGSCSKKGNLNFSYKLALLPEHLSDYVIVHELCHLGELNHSTHFWKLVEKTIPDYKKRREELRRII